MSPLSTYSLPQSFFVLIASSLQEDSLLSFDQGPNSSVQDTSYPASSITSADGCPYLDDGKGDGTLEEEEGEEECQHGQISDEVGRSGNLSVELALPESLSFKFVSSLKRSGTIMILVV